MTEGIEKERQCPKCGAFTLMDEGEGYWLCGICGYDEWSEEELDSTTRSSERIS